MKVAIQGYAGSFHSLAARSLFGDSVDFIFCKTFKDVFNTVANQEADKAVVAIENSLYGSINEVYDLLLKHHFWIEAETYELVSLHLLGIKGATIETIRDVYSQAPALGEAEVFLDASLAHAERREHSDTALAAKEVANWNDTTKAAVASTAAALEYNLEFIEKNIESHPENYTRFIALSQSKMKNSAANKTSLTFQTPDTPGSLHAVLGVFARAGVNLTKLESRPIVGTAWRYMYYVDFNSGLDSEATKHILELLPSLASEIRVLGSYETGLVQKV